MKNSRELHIESRFLYYGEKEMHTNYGIIIIILNREL